MSESKNQRPSWLSAAQQRVRLLRSSLKSAPKERPNPGAEPQETHPPQEPGRPVSDRRAWSSVGRVVSAWSGDVALTGAGLAAQVGRARQRLGRRARGRNGTPGRSGPQAKNGGHHPQTVGWRRPGRAPEELRRLQAQQRRVEANLRRALEQLRAQLEGHVSTEEDRSPPKAWMRRLQELAESIRQTQQGQQQGKQEQGRLRQDLGRLRQDLGRLREDLGRLRGGLVQQAAEAATAAAPPPATATPPAQAPAPIAQEPPAELAELQHQLRLVQRSLEDQESLSRQLQEHKLRLQGLVHDSRQLERAAQGERETTATRFDYFHRALDGLRREFSQVAQQGDKREAALEERLDQLHAAQQELARHLDSCQQAEEVAAAETTKGEEETHGPPAAPTVSVVAAAEWAETRQALQETRRREARLHRAWTHAQQHLASLRRDNEKAQVRQADLERHYLLLHEEVLFLRRRLDALPLTGRSVLEETAPAAGQSEGAIDAEASVDDWQARLEAEFGDTSREETTAEALSQAALAFHDQGPPAEDGAEESEGPNAGQGHASLRLLTEVFEAVTEVYGCRTLEECVQFGIELIAARSPCEAVVGFAKTKPESHEMTCVAARFEGGPPPEGLAGRLLPLAGTLIELATHQGVPVAVSNAAEDPRITEHTERLVASELQSLLCLPLTHEGRIFGAIELVNRRPGGGWPPEEIHAFLYAASAIGEYIALSLPGLDEPDAMAALEEQLTGLGSPLFRSN